MDFLWKKDKYEGMNMIYRLTADVPWNRVYGDLNATKLLGSSYSA